MRVIQISKWMNQGGNFKNSNNIWSSMRIKDVVLGIMILKVIMKIHSTVPIVTPLVRALHPRFLRNSRSGFDMKVDIPDFEGKMQPNDFIDWLTTVE